MRKFAEDTKSLANNNDQFAQHAGLIEANISWLSRHDRRLAHMEGHLTSEEDGDDEEAATRRPTVNCRQASAALARARESPLWHFPLACRHRSSPHQEQDTNGTRPTTSSSTSRSLTARRIQYLRSTAASNSFVHNKHPWRTGCGSLCTTCLA